MYLGDIKIGQGYLGSNLTYQSAFAVTYHVDTAKTYTEAIIPGTTVLEPTTFTPAKTGWDFVGWRRDSDAIGDVETDLTATEPISLYAVFKKNVTATFEQYNNFSTVTGERYYNNGNDTPASVTAPYGDSYSDWTWRGWAAADVASANAAVTYSNGDTVGGLTDDVTIYGLYVQTVNRTFISYSKTETVSGDRYYNAAGNTTKASITIPTGANYSGWTWRGWSGVGDTDGDAVIEHTNGQVIETGSGGIHYGLYQSTITLSYAGNGATGGSTASHTGTRYWNAVGKYVDPKFTLKSNGFTRADSALSLYWGGDGNERGSSSVSYAFNGWNLGAAGSTVTLSANTTASAQWKRTKLYIKFCNGGGLNIPWEADSSATVDLSGFSRVVFYAGVWTADGCGEPTWYVHLNGTQIATVATWATISTAISHNGSSTLRFSHPQTEYRDQYSRGEAYIEATFT
jgi:uncharacterized repeat protein (TIGR02543 family)